MSFKKFFDALKTRDRKKKEIRIMCELGIGDELGNIAVPLKENESAKFKVGDRVIAVKPCDKAEEFFGKTGVVLQVITESETMFMRHYLSTIVQFDVLVQWIDEDGDEREDDIWWCEEDSLELQVPVDYSSLTEIEE